MSIENVILGALGVLIALSLVLSYVCANRRRGE